MGLSSVVYRFIHCLLLVFLLPGQLLARDDKEIVVLLHGIAKSSKHMSKLEGFLLENQYQVINVDYPSTDFELDYLADFIYLKVNDAVAKYDKVHFVGYSMGGLLTRVILEKYRFDNLGKVVQLAAPKLKLLG